MIQTGKPAGHSTDKIRNSLCILITDKEYQLLCGQEDCATKVNLEMESPTTAEVKFVRWCKHSIQQSVKDGCL